MDLVRGLKAHDTMGSSLSPFATVCGQMAGVRDLPVRHAEMGGDDLGADANLLGWPSAILRL
jgi:hypothetical protein